MRCHSCVGAHLQSHMQQAAKFKANDRGSTNQSQLEEHTVGISDTLPSVGLEASQNTNGNTESFLKEKEEHEEHEKYS